jgi:hypothetical protein
MLTPIGLGFSQKASKKKYETKKEDVFLEQCYRREVRRIRKKEKIRKYG